MYLLAGGLASSATRQAIVDDLGLDQPIYVRYLKYLNNVAHGDLGDSYFTSKPVLGEVLQRFAATFELITFAFVLALLIAIPLGVMAAVSDRRILRRIPFVYGMVAGALPEFWWGLMLILIFFVFLGVAPAPLGRVDAFSVPDDSITGIYTLDGILTWDPQLFLSALTHLVLPGVTLAFVYAAPLLKMTRTQMLDAMESDYARYALACGLPRYRQHRGAMRNALLPVITLSGLVYGYLISAAVLVESVFSWGGLGQFAVASVVNSDYLAVAGTVMFVAIFALTVYVLMDILHGLIDPRSRVATET
ncbi:MAG: ABC transporter permease [Nitrospiraceae bacterium]|nr:ABC transporter permease [Nitrospiraceae bacterium]